MVSQPQQRHPAKNLEKRHPDKASGNAEWIITTVVGLLVILIGAASPYCFFDGYTHMSVSEAAVRVLPLIVTLVSFIAISPLLRAQSLNIALMGRLIADEDESQASQDKTMTFEKLVGWRGVFPALIAAGFAPLSIMLLRFFAADEITRSAVIIFIFSLVIAYFAIIGLAVGIGLNYDDWHKRDSVRYIFLGGLLVVYGCAAFLTTMPASSSPIDPCESAEIVEARWIQWNDDDGEDNGLDVLARGQFQPAEDWSYYLFVRQPEDLESWFRGQIMNLDPESEVRDWSVERVYMTHGNAERITMIAVKDGTAASKLPLYWRQVVTWLEEHGTIDTVAATPYSLGEGPSVRGPFPVTDESFRICDSEIPDSEVIGTPPTISDASATPISN